MILSDDWSEDDYSAFYRPSVETQESFLAGIFRFSFTARFFVLERCRCLDPETVYSIHSVEGRMAFMVCAELIRSQQRHADTPSRDEVRDRHRCFVGICRIEHGAGHNENYA
jgi:hypothetical protein